eukprot:CAMPEP_0182887764 /NCGR_PEP_ID=MMETSP0034_2-20130328/21023_1 /TAXON_ID=156128 /ORGANISM="Nephroselmis pyriformis, Strain CCMP717" /LENGTH=75 /DNA_ID=CAMNT_0025021147 /DNA_START=394 /DNA_END=621 /DNA_ORIENTATION=+
MASRTPSSPRGSLSIGRGSILWEAAVESSSASNAPSDRVMPPRSPARRPSSDEEGAPPQDRSRLHDKVEAESPVV